MAIRNDTQRALAILDALYTDDTTVHVPTDLALRVGQSVALVRNGAPFGTLPAGDLAALVLTDLRAYYRQMVKDAEANIVAAAAARAAAEALVDSEVNLGEPVPE